MTDFKSIGAEYTDEYSNSEDAWEFAFSNDRRVIDALTNNTPDDRAEAADEFGMGFADAYVSEPEVEKQEKWDTGGIADYAPAVDIAYDAAVTAVTEAVQAAKGRTKENKPKFLSGTVQVKADLKHAPLVEGGIPAPKPWSEVPADDTNDGLGYDVDYTPIMEISKPTQAMIERVAETQADLIAKADTARVSKHAAYNAMSVRKAISLYNHRHDEPTFMHLDSDQTQDMAKGIIADAVYVRCKASTRAMGYNGLANWLWYSGDSIRDPLRKLAREWDDLCAESGNSEYETN